jgi:hypothetical protein
MYTSTSSVKLPATDAWHCCGKYGGKSYLAVMIENDMLSTFTYGFNEIWISWSNHTIIRPDGYYTREAKPIAVSSTLVPGQAA